MKDLADFLRARYDESEARAHAAAEAATSATWGYENDAEHVSAVGANEHAPKNAAPWVREIWSPILTEAGSYIGDQLDSRLGAFVQEHDPARVLADIEAKRGILDMYDQLTATIRNPASDTSLQAARTQQLAIMRILKLISLPYATHQDYREKWKP